MNLDEKSITAIVATMRMLSNENRLRILNSLHEGAKTWTQLEKKLDINPKSLKHHLDFLKEHNVVTEDKRLGYKLTDAGEAFMVLSINDIITTVQEAGRIIRGD